MHSSILIGIAAVGMAVIFGGEASGYPLASRRLPILLAWLVTGLAILMVIEDVLGRRRRARAGEAAQDIVAPVVWSALLPFAAAIGTFVVLIPMLGFLVVAPVFIGGVLLVSRAVSPSTAIACAIGLTAFIWAVFIWALRMPIPLLPAWF